MPATKEFTVLMEDRPGTLGKVCRALADRKINILALQSFPIGGKSVTRFIVDNPTTAKSVLDSERLTHTETEVVQVKLPHRPGEIARVAARLGEANIGAWYVYASGLLWCRGSQPSCTHSGPSCSRRGRLTI